MWPLVKSHAHRLQIVCADGYMRYILFIAEHPRRIQVKLCETLVVERSADGLLWNLPAICQYTTELVTRHNLVGAHVEFVLTQPWIDEALCYSIKHQESVEQLIKEPRAHHIYTSSLLGPYEDHYLFYIASIARAFLLQLELLVLRVPLHLGHVTTALDAQINLYKTIKGKAYRNVELTYALDHQSIDLKGAWRAIVASLLIEHAHEKHDDLYYALGNFLGEDT